MLLFGDGCIVQIATTKKSYFLLIIQTLVLGGYMGLPRWLGLGVPCANKIALSSTPLGFRGCLVECEAIFQAPEPCSLVRTSCRELLGDSVLGFANYMSHGSKVVMPDD